MVRIKKRAFLARPSRRPLKIYASDPLLGRNVGNRVSVEIVNERLKPGPRGSRVEVIDYDGGNNCFYTSVDLDDKNLLMQGGIDPSESDPRFHQQMVYAVAMRTLESFDTALGRTIDLRRGRHKRLRIFPHAFHGANAFYDRDLNSILFGYFRANANDPGGNFPGQTIYTCLSHDIIAHEVTHAIVDRLRRYFLEPSNDDVLAFHEGFSDIVALFQHFSFESLLRQQIQTSRGNIRSKSHIVELARQFGYATGSGTALRSALSEAKPSQYSNAYEPHDRGAILVGAVFDAFFETYQRRINDLIRIAAGGTGKLPDGDLHPDLVNRIAIEAAKTARIVLTMCIRAFDYLPPVDVTFGDYLRALVTADFELVPNDGFGQRSSMIEAFRSRGIYPHNVASTAEESIFWEAADSSLPRLPFQTLEMLKELVFAATSFSKRPETLELEEIAERMTLKEQSFSVSMEGTDRDLSAKMAQNLHRFARQNSQHLFLSSAHKIEVHGFHPVFRVAPDGRLLIEIVVQFAQQDESYTDSLGGVPLRGGTTVIASADGRVRYVIAKPLPSRELSKPKLLEAEARLLKQQQYLSLSDSTDPEMPFRSLAEMSRRVSQRMSFRMLHNSHIF